MIKELFLLLEPIQRKHFYILQVLMIFTALLQVIGVFSIMPFMAMVGDIQILQRNEILAKLYTFCDVGSPEDFIFWMGIGVLLIIALGNTLASYAIWRLSLFGTITGSELGARLYKYYIFKPWLYHANTNSALLTKQIATESGRITSGIIRPLLEINAKIVLALFMLITIFVYNPNVALVGFIVFTTAYILIYKVVKNKLLNNGQVISIVATKLYKIMSEGFGGIKDILLLGKQNTFVSKYRTLSSEYAYREGTNSALAQIPRNIIELIAFSVIIFLILYLIKVYDGDLSKVLPILSMYALVGLKLLPAFQQIYSGVARIKATQAAFQALKKDLKDSKYYSIPGNMVYSKDLIVQQAIELKNISFSYSKKQMPVLKNLNIHIPVNKTIGIVGSSGSGKSTIIDILTGLIQPQEGTLLLDGIGLTNENLRAWQNSLGVVSQAIFLTDGNIIENVAFGLMEDEIDLLKVKQAIKLAHLNELVEQQLPEGLHTRVGERGVQLSGGQRQRIGIARALYNNANILILDEATSALDGITEKLIMDAIHDFSGEKTIIIVAHRLKTVKQCEIIYYLDQGQVVDFGSYDELIAKNKNFRKMALYA